MLITWLLSTAARAVLRAKRRQYGLPSRVLVDAMVREFRDSTAAEQALWSPWRHRQANAYVEEQGVPSDPAEVAHALRAAYMAGHRAGWEDYQGRRHDTYLNLLRARQGRPLLGPASSILPAPPS